MADTIRVDLHCHSSLSDGALPPARVAERLAAVGVEWAALTDHNTVRGQEQFCATLGKLGIGFISGVEVDVESPEGPLHLLAYGFDWHDRLLRRMLHVLRHPLRSHARYWLDRARSFNGRSAATAEESPPRESPPSFHGLPDIAEAIEVVHGAGGAVFVAHPLTSLLGVERLEALLGGLRAVGLDGLEAFYKPYSEEIQQVLVGVAARRSLLVSAGSDFHGADLPGEGSPGVDVPVAYWDRLRVAFGLEEDRAPCSSVGEGPASAREPLA